MRQIFITEKQFNYIIKKLSESYQYYEIDNDDLSYFCEWFYPEKTGFPFIIGVVDGCIKDEERFPYVYFKKKDKIGKITVSYNPKYVGKTEFNGKNDKLLRSFIINNFESLYLKSRYNYENNVKFHFDSKIPEIIEESPKLFSKSTGLKTTLWLDQDCTYKKGRHGQRIKFQDGESKKTNNFASMTVSEKPEIISDSFSGKIKTNELNNIKKFVKLNNELLLKLGDGKISYYNEFIPNIISFSKNGTIFHGYDRERTFDFTERKCYGFSIVKSNDNLYNYFNDIDCNIVSEHWFDILMPMEKYGSQIKGRGCINGYWYEITLDGTIKCIG